MNRQNPLLEILQKSTLGALLGFLLLHCSVIAHGVRTGQLRHWLRFLLGPVIGFAIIAYVLINAQANAQIAGTAWLAAGVVILLTLKLSGRPAALMESGSPPAD